MNHLPLDTRCLSSLTKVFADEPLVAAAVSSGSVLSNEVYSFQVAYYSDRLLKGVRVRVESDLAPWISVRTVGLAPCELPWRDEHDDDVLRTTPGLYPDPLYPVDEETGVTAFPEQWRSLWVTVDLTRGGAAEGGSGARGGGSSDRIARRDGPAPPAPGDHRIRLVLETDEGTVGSAQHELRVLADELPAQELICTEWFHADCLATWYEVDVWSEDHWLRIEQFVADAVRHGVNMILTPVFTPPLDTAVGGERPTVQLVGVTKRGDGTDVEYSFDFSRLERWVELCDRLGVGFFEFSHLFTQWGARACPKIVAWVDGEENRIFGWETESTGPEYQAFLDRFLPELVAFIRARGLEDRSYYHVSDEPRLEQLDQYRAVREMIAGHLEGFPIMDALSSYEFYEQGAVDLPVPASNHIEPFIQGGVSPLWAYYCVGQRIDVSNRFFAMPSARNRVLGTQLYRYAVAGFLQWGYNFWYAQYSTRPVNPFVNTDAGYAFPSGDAFLVYPGEEGPIDSIRFEVFREALQDLRALRLLESKVGREEAIALLEAGADGPITFSRYPRGADWLLAMRRRVNERIAAAR